MCRRRAGPTRLAVVGRRVRPVDGRRPGLFDFFLGLVTGTGATRGTDSGTDDGTRRSGDRATDDGASGTATKRARAGSGLVVAFGRLTGDRAGDTTDGATDDGARTGPPTAMPTAAPPRTPAPAPRASLPDSWFSGAVPEPSPGTVTSSTGV